MLIKKLHFILLTLCLMHPMLLKAQHTFFVEPILFNKINKIDNKYLPIFYSNSEIFSFKPNILNYNQKINLGVSIGVHYPKKMTSINLTVLSDFIGSNYSYSINYNDASKQNKSNFFCSKSINHAYINIGLNLKRVLLTEHRLFYCKKIFYQTNFIIGLNCLNLLTNNRISKNSQKIISYNDSLLIRIDENDFFTSPLRIKPSLGLNFSIKNLKHNLFNVQIEYIFSNTSIRYGQLPLSYKYVTFSVYDKRNMGFIRSKNYSSIRNYGSGFYLKISKNFTLKKRNNKALPKRNGIN